MKTPIQLMRGCAVVAVMLLVGYAQGQECYNALPNSSWVGVVCYDDGVMHIQMQGVYYKFCGVPYDLFADLVRAASPGSFYKQYIRGRYYCQEYSPRIQTTDAVVQPMYIPRSY